MARVSEVLRHAFRHHYDPEYHDYTGLTTRYLCNAVHRSDCFSPVEKLDACKAIHHAMVEHVKEHGDGGGLESICALGRNATLSGVLRICKQSDVPEALRAWHLALIERLESEGK